MQKHIRDGPWAQNDPARRGTGKADNRKSARGRPAIEHFTIHIVHADEMLRHCETWLRNVREIGAGRVCRLLRDNLKANYAIEHFTFETPTSALTAKVNFAYASVADSASRCQSKCTFSNVICSRKTKAAALRFSRPA